MTEIDENKGVGDPGVITVDDLSTCVLDKKVALEMLMLNMAAMMNINNLRECAKLAEYDDILEKVTSQIMSIGDIVFAVSKISAEDFAEHFKECIQSGRTTREFREVGEDSDVMYV